MDQRVIAAQPKQGVGLKELNAKRAGGNEGFRQDKRPLKAWQKQGIGPNGKASQQSKQRAGASSPAPKQTTKQRGNDLCRACKGDQPDRGQRPRAAGKPKVKVTQKQDTRD